MSSDLGSLLQQAAADSSWLSNLSHEQERALRKHLEAVLGNRTAVTPSQASTASALSADDDLLTVEQVAEMLRMPRQWVYRHAGKWPFTRKLSPKVLRFSRSGALKWLEKQRP